uniref:ATP synthase subunit a n=1 Tax=Galathealinum brachiosum TaxID=53701 RepID=A0A0E3DRA9_9ANNE|nr:ATP synthase F0 subunit 6 [Galathealinum brachiosum]AIL54815.1 ATP synthase F0 subunit 6 [Galathealinum brachiosum]
MMMDIFSSFDQNIFYMDNNIWLMILIFLFILNSSWWMSPSYLWYLSMKIFLFMFTQSSLTLMKSLKSLNFIISSLFLFLIYLNLMGLLPYMFSISSHLIFSLSMSLPIWLSLIMSSFNLNKKETLAHLLPAGAPMWLNPFLIIIEMISIMVRPLTLAFRLAANMSAGHIILILISSYLTTSILMMTSSMIFLFFIQLSYFMFEMAISIIQAYIFCLLLSLYSNDHSMKL